MTASTIHRAAYDQQLQARVQALAAKEVLYQPTLAATDYGKQVKGGFANVMALMWGVAVNSEAAYETAVNSGRGCPGHDLDIITDGAISAAIIANWPYTEDELAAMVPPAEEPPPAPEP
jgi:hypothetical protein